MNTNNRAEGQINNRQPRSAANALRSTMAAIETRLEPASFVRVHRCYIVNLNCV